jgi:beta-glucanase (GH16 family)
MLEMVVCSAVVACSVFLGSLRFVPPTRSVPMMSFRITYIISSIVSSIALAVCSSSGHASASAGAVFDDFDGAEGSRPNSASWDYDPGNPSPANHQLQNYTDSPENIRLDGQGHLVIQAIRSGNGYTSGRLVTRGKVDMLYGRLTARIKMPKGQGIWPAFWMLGSDYGNIGWPECGEIDLMELVNVGTTYNVTLHGPQGRSDYLNGSGVRASRPNH